MLPALKVVCSTNSKTWFEAFVLEAVSKDLGVSRVVRPPVWKSGQRPDNTNAQNCINDAKAPTFHNFISSQKESVRMHLVSPGSTFVKHMI